MVERDAFKMMWINMARASMEDMIWLAIRAEILGDMAAQEEVLGEVLEVVDILMELDLTPNPSKESSTKLVSM